VRPCTLRAFLGALSGASAGVAYRIPVRNSPKDFECCGRSEAWAPPDLPTTYGRDRLGYSSPTDVLAAAPLKLSTAGSTREAGLRRAVANCRARIFSPPAIAWRSGSGTMAPRRAPSGPAAVRQARQPGGNPHHPSGARPFGRALGLPRRSRLPTADGIGGVFSMKNAAGMHTINAKTGRNASNRHQPITPPTPSELLSQSLPFLAFNAFVYLLGGLEVVAGSLLLAGLLDPLPGRVIAGAVFGHVHHFRGRTSSDWLSTAHAYGPVHTEGHRSRIGRNHVSRTGCGQARGRARSTYATIQPPKNNSGTDDDRTRSQ
jgi:hypothetical protein